MRQMPAKNKLRNGSNAKPLCASSNPELGAANHGQFRPKPLLPPRAGENTGEYEQYLASYQLYLRHLEFLKSEFWGKEHAAGARVKTTFEKKDVDHPTYEKRETATTTPEMREVMAENPKFAEWKERRARYCGNDVRGFSDSTLKMPGWRNYTKYDDRVTEHDSLITRPAERILQNLPTGKDTTRKATSYVLVHHNRVHLVASSEYEVARPVKARASAPKTTSAPADALAKKEHKIAKRRRQRLSRKVRDAGKVEEVKTAQTKALKARSAHVLAGVRFADVVARKGISEAAPAPQKAFSAVEAVPERRTGLGKAVKGSLKSNPPLSKNAPSKARRSDKPAGSPKPGPAVVPSSAPPAVDTVSRKERRQALYQPPEDFELN